MPTHRTATNSKASNSKTTTKSSSSLQWAENEFSTLDVKDPRRAKRLKKMTADFHAKPGASIPESSGSTAAAKAAYRLIEGGSITSEDVLVFCRIND